VGVGEAADSAASPLGLSAGVDYLTYTTRSSTTPKVGLDGEPDARAALPNDPAARLTQRLESAVG
jgi:hypothetical protein